MPVFQYILYFALIAVVFFCVWASLGKTVRDQLPLKIAMMMTTISAYLAFMHCTQRTLTMLLVSIAAACAAATYQHFIQRMHLLRHSHNQECR